MKQIKTKARPMDTPAERLAAVPVNATADEIVEFLAIENAKLLASIGQDRRLTPEQESDLVTFYEAFTARYGDSVPVQAVIRKNWPTPPIVLYVAANLLKFFRFPYNREVKLDERQIRWRDSFLEYVLAYKTGKKLSFVVYEPGKNQREYVYETFELPARIPKGSLADVKREVGEWFGFSLAFDGNLILRLYEAGTAGQDIVNGFVFSNGEIKNLRPEELRSAFAQQSDGSDWNEEYQTAFWTAN